MDDEERIKNLRAMIKSVVEYPPHPLVRVTEEGKKELLAQAEKLKTEEELQKFLDDFEEEVHKAGKLSMRIMY